MKPTRLSQPYRQGARAPGAALNAMMRGRSLGGGNTADIWRMTQKMNRAAKQARSRPARPVRPPRPSRPTR